MLLMILNGLVIKNIDRYFTIMAGGKILIFFLS